MKHSLLNGILTLAVIAPMAQAWPKAPNNVTREFEFLGKIDYPCGPNVKEWIINVGVGTPEQVFPLTIDTTTDVSYVNGVMCTTDFCLSQNRFNAGKSSSIINLHEKTRLVFADDEEYVEGQLYQDKFEFNDVVFDDVKFIKVYNTSGIEPSGYAGSFALGFSKDDLPDTDRTDDSKNSLHKRYNRGSIVGNAPPSGGGRRRGRNGRKRDNTADEWTCSLDFGVDYNSISGEIAWCDLPTCDYGASPFWKTQLDGVNIGDAVDLKFNKTLAAFDSTTKDIQVPACDLQTIYDGLGATCADESSEYTFKCENAKDLTFSFEKYDMIVPAETWTRKVDGSNELCTARISESDADDEPTNRWRLGTSFIEEFYFIYSVKRAQTGIALLADGNTGVRIHFK